MDYKKEMKKTIHGISSRHGTWKVFSDFITMAAVSISNSVDKENYDTREELYMSIVKKYKLFHIC